MFIDEECGNFQVVIHGGELTRNSNRTKKSQALQAYKCQSGRNATVKIEVSMIFPVTTFFNFFCG